MREPVDILLRIEPAEIAGRRRVAAVEPERHSPLPPRIGSTRRRRSATGRWRTARRSRSGSVVPRILVAAHPERPALYADHLGAVFAVAEAGSGLDQPPDGKVRSQYRDLRIWRPARRLRASADGAEGLAASEGLAALEGLAASAMLPCWRRSRRGACRFAGDGGRRDDHPLGALVERRQDWPSIDRNVAGGVETGRQRKSCRDPRRDHIRLQFFRRGSDRSRVRKHPIDANRIGDVLQLLVAERLISADQLVLDLLVDAPEI